ncbi:TonB-dependent receptor [Psychrosphaera sp. 1_MG-2023]|uniref:TonB-dependent receptor domain-containing protein n=1 Tax=Psychrosphaera sp. 1_MG-2023 TaxID=3062643 RepID=UPI0026E17EAA|nr:TonB-dependent receptor [Psychrosphaera sp. 1_MG-2023]MDO6721343.1 TonB-dependent receptor [Psychrosphaera sp. 1_MG-2023]
MIFNKKKLASAVSLLLLGSLSSVALAAPEKENKSSADLTQVEKTSDKNVASKEKKEDKTVERIVITGSFIPREGYDGAEPMTIIDEEEMKAKGLLTIADVIESLSENSGYSEGDSGNLLSGFTVGAQEANFRGLGTGRTLVLINGRRVADYPLPFGGEQNGVDLGSIPRSAIARVEYLSSGASAIYGSDAVGGVLNFITKRDMEQTSISGYFGGFEEGYGGTGNISFISGNAWSKGSLTYGIEAFTSKATSADEVPYLQDRRYTTTAISAAEYRAGQISQDNPYVSPDMACEDMQGNMTASESTGDVGKQACTYDGSEGIAMNSDYNKVSFFLDGRYDFTNDVTGFATLLVSSAQAKSSNPSLNWNGYVYGERGLRSDRLYVSRRSFAPDLGYSESEYNMDVVTGVVGVEGIFEMFNEDWLWDVSISNSRYDQTQSSDALKKEAVEAWLFEGSEYYSEVAETTYEVDNDFFDDAFVNNIFRDASADRDLLVGQTNTEASSTASSFQAKLAGSISDFGLLYNPMQMALVLDYNRSTTEVVPDARALGEDGLSWMNIGSVYAKGTRERYAAGVEFRLPLTQKLEVTLATRYDEYNDDSSIGGRQTSQAKFVYLLTEAIKMRGGMSQSFRAPDMFNIYGESKGFTGATDLLSPGCYDGEAFVGNCSSSIIRSTRSGSDKLEEEKGSEKSIGFAYSPNLNFGVSIDWWSIRLNDMVTSESAFDLFVGEWQCENGERNSDSQFCEDVNSRIQRDSVTNELIGVTIQPQNQEFVEKEGLDIRVNGNWESAALGRFGAGISHSATLKHDWLRFAGDEVVSLVDGQLGLSTPNSVTNLYLTYSNNLTGFRRINSSLFIRRQSAVNNFIGTKKLPPYYTANASVSYSFDNHLNLQFVVNNLTNEMPVTDETSPRWPYYWSHLQSPLGRSVALSFSYPLF